MSHCIYPELFVIQNMTGRHSREMVRNVRKVQNSDKPLRGGKPLSGGKPPNGVPARSPYS